MQDFNTFINPLFLLFITLSGNFLAPIFPCQIQKLFTESMYHKHILAFFTLFFAIVLSSSTNEKISTNLLTKTLLLYLLFIFITRMDKNFFILFIIILGVKYVLENEYEDISDEDTVKKNNIKYINNILTYALVIIGIIGFLFYYGEKKYEYGSRFNYLTFLVGKVKCEGNIMKTNYIRNIKHIF